MDALNAVQARISAIEARLGVRHVREATDAAPGSGAGTGLAFEDVLAAELAPATTAAVPVATPRPTPGPTGQPQAPAAPLTPAERLDPGQYGRLEPPADLAHYGNGRVPAAALAPLGVGSHRLWAPAAAAFSRLRDAARAEGIDIGVTDSYRDLAAQKRLAARKGLYSQGGLAAKPGTSNHGWGVALDLDLDAPAQAWMREHAWQYGFVEDVPREPWHWTYRPAR